MDDLQVRKWLMVSSLYDEHTKPQCVSCASCSVCHKNNNYYSSSDHHSRSTLLPTPPRLVRVLPEDMTRTKTEIFTPRNPYLHDTLPTVVYDKNIINRIYKRRNSDNIDFANKRFCTERPVITTTTATTPPMLPPPSPPSPHHRSNMYQEIVTKQESFDSISSDEEVEKQIIDGDIHKNQVERAKYERTIKLYKFLIDLLEDQHPCVIWITRETGIFKIKDSEKLARLWGEVKLNPTMNYEKLARSFRHYYKKGILDSGTTLSKCGKRKLYYKFSAQMLKKYLNI